MAQSLQDKVAIVTGASSGIGRAVARELARNGVRLVLTARSQERLDALANDIDTEILVAPADMASSREIRSIVERALGKFGRLDIVLANAGIYLSGDVVDGDPDAWDQLISVNVNGVFRLVHAALPHLIAQHSGGCTRHELNLRPSGNPLGTDLQRIQTCDPVVRARFATSVVDDRSPGRSRRSWNSAQ